MSSHEEQPLHERIERLEASVDGLRAEVEALRGARQTARQAPPAREDRPTAKKPAKRKKRRSWPSLDWDSENWLSRIGIALTLFGVAFFFKFSVDQGWLVPAVQVALGAAFGALLLGAGLRLRRSRARLGQILLGGSSAVFYATVFAAYQLYGLMAYPLAFTAMALVTAGTFWLAVGSGDAALAVVGVLGGLGTPFLLYSEAGSVPGLVGYTCLIIGGASAIYLWRGWRALLYTAVVGGWLTLAYAAFLLPGGLEAIFSPAISPVIYAVPAWWKTAEQFGVVFAWLVFWGVPAAREVLAARHPDRWRTPSRVEASSLIGSFLFRPPAHTLAFSSPLIALAFSRELWQMPGAFWGGVALGGCVLYALTYVALRREDAAQSGSLRGLAQAHALVAAVLLAYGSSELLGGDTFLVALAAEGAAFHVLARTLSDRALRFTAHGFFLVAGVLAAGRLVFEPAAQPVLIGGAALSVLAVIALGAAASFALPHERGRQVYRVGAHVLLLGWLFREVGALGPSGQAYVSIAWGAYAVALLALGLVRNHAFVRAVALATLLVLVGKLFLIDLAALGAGWRVLLFLGLGAFFLVLSYFLPGLLGMGERVSGREGERAGG